MPTSLRARAVRISLLAIGLVCSLLVIAAEAAAGQALERILRSGVLRAATDSTYPPLSFLREDGMYDGFDVAVVREIARRMGVKPKFTEPEWESIVGGRWRGRWDVSVGSMTATSRRAKRLEFPAVYYFAPAMVAVRADDPSIHKVTDLSGLTIGSCGGCTYADHLRGQLSGDPLLAPHIVHEVTPGLLLTYETDRLAIKDLVAGAIDAVLLSRPSIEGAMADGFALRMLEEPMFYEPLAIAVEKGDPELSGEIARIVEDMLEDGTLASLSERWLGRDYTRKLP